MNRRRSRRISKTRRAFNHIVDTFMRISRRTRLIMLGGVVLLVAVVIIVATLPHDTAASVQNNNDELAAAGDMDIIPSPTPEPTPTPEPVPTPTPDPTLQRGDENERVQQLQERLMELNYLDIDETTQLFGPATQHAVQLFQRQHGLQQDGIAGPTTLDKIFAPDAQTYMILEGTEGEDVTNLQRQLVDLGYLSKTTGYYGTETIDAIKDFQSRNGLASDGKTGPHTLDTIYSPDAKPSKDKVQSAKRRANIVEMINIAKDQLGDPYRSGHEGPNSFDCSGLVYYCLKQAGSSRGRYNAAGYSQVSDWKKITSMNDLEKGDLLFFSTNGKKVGHTGIYIGNGQMVDASSSNGKVVKRSCVTPFWKRNFVCARRPW